MDWATCILGSILVTVGLLMLVARFDETDEERER